MTPEQYERKKAYERDRYQKNREAVLARNKAWNSANPAKIKDKTQKWRAQNPERAAYTGRANHLRKTYGLTPEDWDALFLSQGQCCAICRTTTPGDKRNWHTDHDHETSKVRGILCANCNRIVHKLATPEVLQRAAEYVRSHHGPVTGGGNDD
jgi:Recombination endonuclease VII